MSNQRDSKGKFLPGHKPILSNEIFWENIKENYYKSLQKIIKKRKEENNE